MRESFLDSMMTAAGRRGHFGVRYADVGAGTGDLRRGLRDSTPCDAIASPPLDRRRAE
jgi:hypothetical protein